MQPKKKKSAKKAGPKKPPLIRGKYTHEFMYRCFPNEGKILEEVQALMKEKTWTQTIHRALAEYNRLTEQLAEYKALYYGEQAGARDLRAAVAVYIEAFSNLEKTLKAKPVKVSKDRNFQMNLDDDES
jgi:hypothetical protein